MKQLLPAILLFFSLSSLTGQTLYETKEGKVSYVTTQTVYVKFQSTENIAPGDTLFSNQDGTLIPLLTVREKSSISCVCLVISEKKISVGDQVFSKQKPVQIPKTGDKKTVPELPPLTSDRDSVIVRQEQPSKRLQVVTGNISVASYLNFSSVSKSTQRMKYNFAMAVENIGNSRLSAETYISFAHKLGEWNTVQHDIFNGLKIYSLSLNYMFNKHNKILLGRKINPRISNVGAIDGLQYETKAGAFSVGLLVGSRPDYRNYSFNANLLQFGGYVGHDHTGKNGNMQTTLAFFEQKNNGITDRRFAYLQHTNPLVRNLYFFGSLEVDLYKKTMNHPDTAVSKDTTYNKDYSPALSNLYLSLRYRPVRQLSLSLSYSARQNVIYYETYKSLVERLLEEATVQGFTFQINYQPVKLLSIGINAGYRNSKTDPRPSKNIYGYVSFSRIPGINVTSTVSATILETGYLSGNIYSLGVSRDVVEGKLTAGMNYRYVSYRFQGGETQLVQNMGEINFTWRILRKLSCGLYYEGTFDKSSTFNRIYVNLTQRF
ncbi:MAG: hypothetical protein Q8M08_06700 [Bacteroidales bacterium]|nr:hypothetical protein [Bacteroidales bacterium]